MQRGRSEPRTPCTSPARATPLDEGDAVGVHLLSVRFVEELVARVSIHAVRYRLDARGHEPLLEHVPALSVQPASEDRVALA